jgi:hypothetical protein
MNELPLDMLTIVLSHFQRNEESFLVGMVCKKWNSIIKRYRKISFLSISKHYAAHGGLSALQLFK